MTYWRLGCLCCEPGLNTLPPCCHRCQLLQGCQLLYIVLEVSGTRNNQLHIYLGCVQALQCTSPADSPLLPRSCWVLQNHREGHVANVCLRRKIILTESSWQQRFPTLPNACCHRIVDVGTTSGWTVACSRSAIPRPDPSKNIICASVTYLVGLHALQRLQTESSRDSQSGRLPVGGVQKDDVSAPRVRMLRNIFYILTVLVVALPRHALCVTCPFENDDCLSSKPSKGCLTSSA